MKNQKFIQIFLFILVCSSIISAQKNNDVKVAVISQVDINRYFTDVGPADLRINIRVKNESQKDIFLFGTKYEKEFDPMFHLLNYDNSQKKWIFPSFNLETVSADEKIPYRIKKGKYFDFYSITARRTTKKLFKVAVYYGYSKKDKPNLLESDEFFIESVKNLDQ